jgi:hypothetical protein
MLKQDSGSRRSARSASFAAFSAQRAKSWTAAGQQNRPFEQRRYPKV